MNEVRILSSFLWLAVWAIIFTVAPAQAGGVVVDDPMSPNISNCSGPASTPACAAWTWSLCRWAKDKDLCAVIGMKNLVFVRSPLFDNGKPRYPSNWKGHMVISSPSLWVETLDKKMHQKVESPGNILFYDDGKLPLGNSRIIGVRKVSRKRFVIVPSPDNYQMPERMIGTHEVMIGGTDSNNSGPHQSEFFSKEEGRWKLVSWATESEDCQFRGDDWRADCLFNNQVEVWSDYYPLKDWCPNPRDGWCPW